MRIMLAEPPAVAEPEQEIGVNETERLVPRRAAEDFLMACVVNDKTQLSEDEGEESGVAKFRPWIVKLCDQQESADEQNEIEKHLADVIGRLLGQQTAVPHEGK